MTRRSIGSIAVSGGLISLILEIYWGGAISYYFMRNLGLDIKYETAAWGIFMVWSAIDGSITGTISDRSKSRLGRRVPFIRTFGPLLGIVFILAFIDLSFISSQIALAAYFLMIICSLDFCISFLEGNMIALPLEELVDERDRGHVLALQTIFDTLALLVFTILIPVIQPDAGEDTTTFRMIMSAIGAIAGIGLFVLSFFIESTYRPVAVDHAKVPLKTYILQVWQNKPFLICEIFNMSVMITYSTIMFGLYYYLDEVPNNPLFCYGFAFAGLLLGILVYHFLLDRIGVKGLAIFMCGVPGVAFLIGILAGPTSFGGACAGFGGGVSFIGYTMVYALMFGDTVDYDESITGLRREGVSYGVDCMFVLPSNASHIFFLLIISAFGYVEHVAEGSQSFMVQEGIMVGWLLIPGILMTLSAIIITFFYPLNRSKAAEIKQQILERRAEYARQQ